MNLKEKLKAYSEISSTGCWVWQRARLTSGYGYISVGHQKQEYAHRVSYREFNGEIPDGMVVRHKCDNPSCCNPEHLEIGTQYDNVQDCIKRGRHKNPPVHTGESNHKTKLNKADIEYIISSGEKIKDLAARFGVTPQAIRWRIKQWHRMQLKE